jgi:gliding motility-associatede transport system auxiliary component
MNAQWLRARQTKYAAYATVYILVVLAILTVANVLADRYNKSHDFTATKRYTLSDQTDKIVKGLKQDATITYFDQTSHFAQAKDLLDRYANLSTKVHVVYVDPDHDPEKARAANIRDYGTAVVQVGLNKEQAKGITEQGITGAFIQDEKGSTRTVCFVGGSGERQIDDTDKNGFSDLKDLLAKDSYATKSISLLQQADVPGDCTVLVVGGPVSDYLQPAVDAVKKYVESGGRVFFMLDPPLKIGRSPIADNNALNMLLASWGVTADRDLILDMNPIGQLAGVGPQVALVTTYGPHPIVVDMRGHATGFPLSRSLEIKNGDKTTVEKLFDSSATAVATVKLDSPDVNPNDPQNKKGPLTLAAAGTYNTGKENSEGRFVVVGGSSWAANAFIAFNGNSDFALNAMNWLSSDEDLISIRPKEQEDRRVTLTAAQMNMITIFSQFMLPLAIVFVGVSVWWRRR